RAVLPPVPPPGDAHGDERAGRARGACVAVAAVAQRAAHPLGGGAGAGLHLVQPARPGGLGHRPFRRARQRQPRWPVRPQPRRAARRPGVRPPRPHAPGRASAARDGRSEGPLMHVYLKAHGFDPGPTLWPGMIGAQSGLLAMLPALAVLKATGALEAAAASLHLAPGGVAAGCGLAGLLFGLLYGRIFLRATND